MVEEKGLICPECGAPMVLRNSKYGKFYGCSKFPVCTTTHGAHTDGTPLGIPADKETKQWRIKAHEAFDTWWSSNQISRTEAYKSLQMLMKMTPDEAHIGRFDIEQCTEVIKLFDRRGGLWKVKL